MYTGLAHSCYAKLVSHVDGSRPVYQQGKMLDIDVAADLEFQTRDASFSASNGVVATDRGLSGMTINMEEGDVPPEDRLVLFGETKDGTTYRVTDQPGDYVGYGFMTNVETNGSQQFETYWIYKTQFGKAPLSFKTKPKDSIEWGTVTMTGEAMPLRVSSDMAPSWYEYERHATEQTAVAWLKTRLGITE